MALHCSVVMLRRLFSFWHTHTHTLFSTHDAYPNIVKEDLLHNMMSALLMISDFKQVTWNEPQCSLQLEWTVHSFNINLPFYSEWSTLSVQASLAHAYNCYCVDCHCVHYAKQFQVLIWVWSDFRYFSPESRVLHMRLLSIYPYRRNLHLESSQWSFPPFFQQWQILWGWQVSPEVKAHSKSPKRGVHLRKSFNLQCTPL